MKSKEYTQRWVRV